MRSLFVPNPEGKKRPKSPMLPPRAASHRLPRMKSKRLLSMEDTSQSLASKTFLPNPQPLPLSHLRVLSIVGIRHVDNVQFYIRPNV